jgi:hypothetical protein
MGQFGYSYEKVFFQLEGESHIGEMHSSRSFRTRSFCVPSIPLIGSIDYDGSYLQVRGYNERGSVVLPERFVEPHRAVLEFGPNSFAACCSTLIGYRAVIRGTAISPEPLANRHPRYLLMIYSLIMK